MRSAAAPRRCAKLRNFVCPDRQQRTLADPLHALPAEPAPDVPTVGITPDDIIVGCAPLQTRSGTDKEAGHLDACVHACLEAGMVRFDTAPKYGDAEDVLGRGLANSPLGDTAIIYTKVGKYQRWSRGSPPQISGPIDPWVPFSVPKDDRAMVPDYSKAGAAQSMKESMDRMQVERCHTLRLHDPDSIEGAMELALDPETGIVAGLRELRAAGIIQNVSFGMNANKDHLVITPVSYCEFGPRFSTIFYWSCFPKG